MPKPPAAKRRRISPPESPAISPESSQDGNSANTQFLRNAAEWDLEQEYEQRPRKLIKGQNGNGRLPVKTADGWVEPLKAPEPEESGSEGAGSFVDEEEWNPEGSDEVSQAEEPEVPKVSQRKQILEAKEELARVASLVNEDPEEHIGSLKTLARIADTDNTTVKKLALATQLAVYKDVIPGYRIRPWTEESLKEKLSKDVRRLRNFEQALVSGYQDYIHDLTRCASKSKKDASEERASLTAVAISCACNLLTSVPHFNFRGDILKILVQKLSQRIVDADFVKCREAIESLFHNDEDGNSSLDAVTQLTKMIKGKNYIVNESVVNTFLHLRLLSELNVKASSTKIDKPVDDNSLNRGKKPKQKREFRTKRERKVMRERKVIEKEMKEADAAVSHEERDRMQSETLKLVFATYFRILKARTPHLMGAVLEGLAKYAHLINQDFFGDILEALKDLISAAEASKDADIEDSSEEDEITVDESAARNVSRESLLCVITAFALLQGQDAAASASTLHLDLSFFITHLYRTLHPVSVNPDIERSAKTARLADPDDDSTPQTTSHNKVNIQTTTVLLLKSLSSVLLPPTAIRAVPPQRVAAFTKQLLTASLQLPEKSCLAMLGLLTKVAKVHGRKIAALWNTEERRGDGTFNALSGDAEKSNPFAGTVWEGELLRLHWSPSIREAVVGLERCVVDAR